jgi:hypothetical protein
MQQFRQRLRTRFLSYDNPALDAAHDVGGRKLCARSGATELMPDPVRLEF